MATIEEQIKHKCGATCWHVNAIKGGRIVGDETAAEYDKITINSYNATIATVYRAGDARIIANAHRMAAMLKRWADCREAHATGGLCNEDHEEMITETDALLA